jgi:hypothetical protein
MPAVTYFVALPFVWGEDGELVAGEAQERVTSLAAVRAAQALAATSAGAVAFSRTGDPSTGDFSDAEIIRSFGTVPDVDTLLAAP